jgi:hypothetical protein
VRWQQPAWVSYQAGRPRHVKPSQTQGDILHGVNDALLGRYVERRSEIVNRVGVVEP